MKYFCSLLCFVCLVATLGAQGLTHSYVSNVVEPNRFRVSPLVNQRSFGILRIDWSAATPKITMEARGLDNVEFFKIEF